MNGKKKADIDGKGAQPHNSLMLMYHISAQGVARPCDSLAESHKKTHFMTIHKK